MPHYQADAAKMRPFETADTIWPISGKRPARLAPTADPDALVAETRLLLVPQAIAFIREPYLGLPPKPRNVNPRGAALVLCSIK